MEVDKQTTNHADQTEGTPNPANEDINMADSAPAPTNGVNNAGEAANTSLDAPASPADVTSALEAALEQMMPATVPAPTSTGNEGTNNNESAGNDQNMEEAEHPEWEEDSSPYESSSDSDSSDDSSDEDSEDEGGYPLLGIDETARLLMAEMDDADGDGTAKTGKGAAGALRTKNEIAEEPIPKPDVSITPDMPIEHVGEVQFIVEKTVVIKSQSPGEVKALDSGSILCKEDRTVIGVLADVIGNVRNPMYTVMFAKEDDIKEIELTVGTPVFYSVNHAQYVFTRELKQMKGTDASNLHDEEVAAEEMEFSDDEKEAEYKRAMKLKKRGGKAGRGGREQTNQPQQFGKTESGPSTSLNYDEDDDGPYKPLSRPPGFGQGLSALPPKPETGITSPPRGGHHRGSSRGGRGDFRGRNQRGGNRGRDSRPPFRGGRGGSQSYSYDGNQSPQTPSFPSPQIPVPPPSQNPHFPPPPFGQKLPAMPPVPPSGHWPAVPVPYPPPPVSYTRPQASQPPVPPQVPTGNFNFNYQAWSQNTPGQQQYQYPQAPHHQAPTPPPQQQHAPAAGYPQPPVPPAWPGAGSAPQAPPAGAYVNPAFFSGLQHPQQQAQTPPAQHQPQHQPPAQQYWGQQHQHQQHPQNPYGQGPN